MTDDAKLAVFFDFENLALGVRDTQPPKQIFQVGPILQRLVEKGKIVVKRAYADWEGYAQYRRTLHESGVELIYLPKRGYSGKNSADIRMVVDAMDLCFSKEHLTIFVIASGDSDFTPLVTKLRENDKTVIGVGVKNSTSALFVENCDEFLFYEDLVRHTKKPRAQINSKVPKKKAEAFQRTLDAIEALVREAKDVIWGSMVKQTIKRKHPDFDEGYYGYSSFSQLLTDMQSNSIIDLEKDSKSGGYIITAFEEE